MDGQCAAVAHGRADLCQRLLDVIGELAGVGHVGVHALLEGQLLAAAEVVALPVARAVGALAPVLLHERAVDVDLVRRALVEAGEVAAEHHEVRAHGQRERDVVIVHDAAVGADGHVDAGLAEVLVACAADLDDGGRLAAADALGLARDADRAAADADLDKVRAALGEEAEAVAVNDVARADLDGAAVVRAHIVDDLLLPDGIALGRVDAQHVRTGFDESRDALSIVAGVDARADEIALLIVLQGKGMFLMLGVVLAEDEVEQMVVFIHDGQRVELVLPDDVVGFLERGGRGSGDKLFARRHELAHLQISAHAAHAVIAARHDAEELAVGRCILSDRNGGKAVFLLEREHVRKRVLRRQVGGGGYKARLAALHAAHHLRLALDGLRAEDERKAALLGKGDGQRVVRHRLHNGRDHRDIQADGALLLPLAVAHKGGFERDVVGNAVLGRVAGDEQIFAERVRRFGIVVSHGSAPLFLNYLK